MLAERVKEWNRQSMEKGVQEGIQQGIQQGQRQGARRILVRLLEKKFGALPDNSAERISRADEEQIMLWSERVLTADSLGDVFGN